MFGYIKLFIRPCIEGILTAQLNQVNKNEMTKLWCFLDVLKIYGTVGAPLPSYLLMHAVKWNFDRQYMELSVTFYQF